MTPEQIKALGEAIAPLVTAVFAFLTTIATGVITIVQVRCRQDIRRMKCELNVAHAKLRARDSGKTWQEEMWDRSKPWKGNGDESDPTNGA